MGITSTGIGSGLDIESIITKLMAVEKRPLTALQTKEAAQQAKLTGFGTLKSILSQFQTAVNGLSNASKFQGVTASVADSSIASVTASASATAGSFSLEVSKLAQAQKLATLGQASDTAAISNGVITIDFGTISGGTLTDGKYVGSTFASSGSGVKTITIDDSNNSLAGIRDAINKAGIGVTATIVNDGGTSPYRLALSVTNSGKANSIKISVADDVGGGSTALSTLLNNNPEGTQNLSETVSAQNAEFKVNGIVVSKSSNAITDVIAGVTLNLAKVTTSATTINIARDTAAVSTAVTTFVSAYNTIAQSLKDSMAYNADTKSAAVLNGEASVRSIQAQIRSVLNTPIAGGASTFTLLSHVGVTMQKNGLLSVDNSKLQAALNTNFSDFAGLFAAAGKTSDSLVSFGSASDKTKVGAYDVNITQLATKASLAGTAAPTTLVIGSSNNSLQVLLDGVTATITLNQKTYNTAADLATEIQSKINGAPEFSSLSSTAKVTISGGKLLLSSDRYGSASKIDITGGNGQANLNLGTTADGLDVAGTINGVAASGSGQTLTGATGDASEGIKLLVTGGITGSRGTVNYSHGYAYQFDKLTTTLLGEDGPIHARTDGLSAVIKRMEADQVRINTRLESIEKRYRSQFSALDVMMSSMSTTSTFLTQQLAGLANLNKQSS